MLKSTSVPAFPSVALTEICLEEALLILPCCWVVPLHEPGWPFLDLHPESVCKGNTLSVTSAGLDCKSLTNAATSPAAATVMCVGQKERRRQHMKSNVRDLLQWCLAGELWLVWPGLMGLGCGASGKIAELSYLPVHFSVCELGFQGWLVRNKICR